MMRYIHLRMMLGGIFYCPETTGGDQQARQVPTIPTCYIRPEVDRISVIQGICFLK